MYIQRNKTKNPNGKEYISTMLCEKYRVKGDKNPKTRTLLNISHLPEDVIMSIESTLKSKKEAVVKLADIQVEEVVDFGYFFVINKLMEDLKINSVLEKSLPAPIVKLVKIMIVGILISTNSKLGILNWLQREEFVAKIFDIESKKLTEKDFYNALTVLNLHKLEIDKKWFRHHNFQGNSIYLYDITSSYFEGVQNELAAFGYNRDGKKGKMQICIGLVTDNEGFPLKIDVFKGNTNDSETVENQIEALRKDFGIEDIIFVGDEHCFRNLKSDLISMHLLNNCNQETIIGHAQICFFAYSIIKSMENKLLPFLLDYNKQNKTKLSFNDLVAELQNIKLCKLRIGRKSGVLQFPKLNDLQTNLFQIFKLNPNDMTSVII